MNYLTSSQISKNHLRLLLFLSLLLLILSSICSVPGVLDKPQFTNALDSIWLADLLHKNPYLYYSYYGTFIVDFIWAPTLLLALWKFVKKQKPKQQIWVPLTAVLALLALGFDYTENIGYWFSLTYIDWIANIKIGLFAATGIIYIYFFAVRYWKSHWPTLFKFLTSSALSLVILMLFGLLLPKASQINSIVVNLYNYPINFIFLFLLAPIYATVLAHYPSYFHVNPKYQSWFKAKGKVGFWGIIYNQNNKEPNTDDKEYSTTFKEDVLNFLWRSLGIVFYAALFYFIGYTSQVNFSWHLGMGPLAMLILVLGILQLYRLKNQKDNWLSTNYPLLSKELPDFYDGDQPSSMRKNPTKVDLLSIRIWVKRSLMWFSVMILIHLGLIIYLLYHTNSGNNLFLYNNITAIWSLLCIVLQLISYIYYRTFRSAYRLVLFRKNAKLVMGSFLKLNNRTSENQKKLYDFFNTYDFIQKDPVLRFYSLLRFGVVSNNIIVLQCIAIAGAINGVFLLIINLFSDLSLSVNTSLLILSYLFLFYGMLVILSKHFIYYRLVLRKPKAIDRSLGIDDERRRGKCFNTSIFVIVFVLIALRVITVKMDNQLFTLPQMEKTSVDLNLNKYVHNLPENTKRYYIGTYGGGMKANAWTLVVLNEMFKRDPELFEKTVVLSGVSGGGIGIMNMSAMAYMNPIDKWDTIIGDLSTENLLSLDITHMLGRDALTYTFWPGKLSGKDRSSTAMNRYATLTGNKSQIRIPFTFRQYWDSLYNHRQSHFPLLIANTTNVKGNQGMAISIKVENTYARSLAYNGADSILDIRSTDTTGPKTLSFYNGFSTSNRFPFISPAAKIETKGQYNDGGIFENSGLLSAYKMFEAINYLDTVEHLNDLKQCNVFINIVNSKDLYILSKLDDYKDCVKEINESSELSAVLTSIIATEMMPNQIKSKLTRIADVHTDVEFETIYLPHLFTVADVKRVLGKVLACNGSEKKTHEDLYHLVQKNNESIRSVIQEGITSFPLIEPPMSRVIAKQAYDFMVNMVQQDTITDKIMEY